MGAFSEAWSSLKKDAGERPLGYTPTDYDTETDTAAAEAGGEGLNEYGDSNDPVNDAHEHFYASPYHASQRMDFNERREALARDVSHHLSDVFNSYKDEHPEWDPSFNSDTRSDREGPPGTTELSALIENMAKKFGARVPW